MIRQGLTVGLVSLLVFFVVLIEYLDLQRSFFAWLVLLYLIFWTRKQRDWILLWVIYSFAFWGTQLGREDGTALLVLSTLAHASLIVASYFIPPHMQKNEHLLKVVAAFLVTPLACNNLFFHPFLSLFRLLLFIGTQFFFQETNSSGIGSVYLLFSKVEALLPLVATHLAVKALAKKYGKVIPILPTSSSSAFPATQEPPQPRSGTREYFKSIIGDDQ
jgi:hypothetical protein